ncbi:hypothetical protein [Flavobacterium sp. J27]|uniref:hypothetical protein n=1 Tax=Flavobacterium sp. J27 TaxID=2060419 RepID=UPI001030870B|nr:hypothetical protein [Flavobacterium sp. J27]
MDFSKYYQPHKDYFWRCTNSADELDDNYSIIEMFDGSTIAYTNHVVEILELLSDESIPPFGALLLAIIATNQNSEATLVKLHHYAKSKERTSEFPNANLYRTGAAFDFLKILSELPEIYKSGDQRILLFKTIFEKCHNRVGSQLAKKIIYDFKKESNTFFTQQNEISFNEATFVKDFRTIALLKQTYPTKESLLKALTALPELDKKEELIEEITSESELSNKPTDFIDELIQEMTTFHVGSLIHRIWSGLNIPFHHNVPSQQPMGGVSDLTNKGDFDRLLLSEFANDDTLFLSRLANNEALFIQREIPPQDNKKTRILLIDVSLKNWGNPKTIAFATALAIMKHPKTDIECVVYAFGNNYINLNLDSVFQVTQSLGQLSSALDGTEGLQLFLNNEYTSLGEVELFILTTYENLESISFQNVLNENYDKINFIITTDEVGSINTYKIKNRVRNHVKTIQLPLDELWRNVPKLNTRKRINRNGLSGVPILYPVERTYQNIFHYEETFYLFLNTNLYEFESKEFKKGFEKLGNHIPFYLGEYAILKKNANLILVNWLHEKNTIQLYDVNQKNIITKEIAIHTEEIIRPFTFQETIYITDGEHFYRITDTFDCIVTSDETVKGYFKNYEIRKRQFVSDYKRNNNKYTIFNNLKSVEIDHNYTSSLVINGYHIYSNTFISYSKVNRGAKNIRLDRRVSLILKKYGANRAKLVQYFFTVMNLKKSEINFKEMFPIRENLTFEEAEKIKIDLENLGATCYIETTHFVSSDGSSITVNNGILELKSSDTTIPKIFIPFVIEMPSALATDTVFTGNPYFLPEGSNLEVIETQNFHDKYYISFIQHILDHEVNITA